MIALDAQVSAADVADLERAIDLMISGTTRSGKDAVQRAAYQFLRSAKAQTPRAKRKLRRLYTANDAGKPQWEMRKGKRVMIKASRPSKYYLVRTQTGTYKILMPNPDLVSGRDRKRKARETFNELKKKYREKPRVGAATDSWNRAYRDLGKPAPKLLTTRNARIAAASRAKKLGVDFAPSIRITNDLSYLPKIAPRLEASASRAAGKVLLKMVERGIEKQTRKF
jgi:hypothetical protein